MTRLARARATMRCGRFEGSDGCMLFNGLWDEWAGNEYPFPVTSEARHAVVASLILDGYPARAARLPKRKP